MFPPKPSRPEYPTNHPTNRRGQYGQDIFTLNSTYFQGRPPKSVNLHWRRFAVKDIPFDDTEKFSQWLHDRWVEKDALLEQYQNTGRFPADNEEEEPVNGATKYAAKGAGYIETEVQLRNRLEPLQVFVPVACLALLVHLVRRILHMVLITARLR
jgi:lysocardiolipin and lysophospholipid acyltransferase